MTIHKWRPSFRCIYVIPEISGNIKSLEILLERILPLRIFKNQEDVLIFLGNYINGDLYGDRVLDCLINIKQEYGDRVVILRGKFEEMMLRSCINSSNKYFDYWIDNGGISTIEAYISRNKLSISPYAITKNRLLDIIPKHHIDFISVMEYNYIIDNYCFIHNGFDYKKHISDNNIDNFIFDTTSGKYFKFCFKNKKMPEFLDNYTFITNDNNISNKPFIHPKYFMLGGSAPNRLFCFELNSMSSVAIKKTKSRIYKYNFNICE